MRNKIILVGKGSSGKDFLRKSIIDRRFKPAIMHTSRPVRNGELNGVDYYFLTKEYFQTLEYEKYFMQVKEFNGWFYGLSYIEWNNCDVIVLTPSNVKDLPEFDRKNSYVIYLDIPHDVRKERLEKRNDADSVERRLGTDEEDFKDFIDYDLRLTSFDVKNISI
jgi:guanylate kinase